MYPHLLYTPGKKKKKKKKKKSDNKNNKAKHIYFNHFSPTTTYIEDGTSSSFTQSHVKHVPNQFWRQQRT
jgi:hypothetical protein